MNIKDLRFTPPPHTQKGNKWQRTLLAVAVISVLFNVLAVLPYIQPYYNKVQKKLFPTEHFTNTTPDKEVLEKVCKATVELDGVKMSMNELKGLPEDLKSFFRSKRNTSAKNNFFTSYAMVGASYYAMQQNDSLTMDELKRKTEDFIDFQHGCLNYPIVKVDQAPIGLLLLNLYKWYKDERYMKVVKNLYTTVKDMKDSQDRLLYAGKVAKADYVDALGMYVPFFMEYFKETNDSTAFVLVNRNMERYQQHAVNDKTGIPAHGYDLRSGIPVGSANWGRGIGWYLLAAAYCPQMQDSILNHTLAKVDYTQFPGNSEQFDSSTALMFEIYKQSKDKKRKLSLDFIKPYVMTTGFVDNCSGDTYDFNDYSHTFSESELCNGLLLILASKFDNSQSENEQN